MSEPRDWPPRDATRPMSARTQRLGEYELVRKVGAGGMGVVHLAHDARGHEVALKVLRSHVAHDDEAITRLRREVATLSRVRDPHIAAVLDADLDGPSPYIVTEFVPGPPLDDFVDENGPLTAEELVDLGRGLSSALEATHAEGIVHRDVKPGNVLMVQGQPVLIDFGIAHVADDSRLTRTGLVMGTPGYLSPEIVDGADVTPATDWWGWAATLAYAASGRSPFGTGPMAAVLDRVAGGRADLSGVDPRLAPLLAAALDPDPSQRPSAEVILSELEDFAHGRPMTRRMTEQARSSTTILPAPFAPGAGVDGADDDFDGGYAGPGRRQRRVATAAGGGYDGPPHQGSTGQFDGGYAPDGYGYDDPAPYEREIPPAPPAHSGPVQQPYSHTSHPDQRIGLPRRSGTLFGVLAAAVGLSAVLPYVFLILAVLWSLAARTIDRSMTATVLRRFRRPPRRGDSWRDGAMVPWHAIAAAFITFFAMILPVLLGLLTAAGAALGIAQATGGNADSDLAVPIAAGALVGIVMMWWGPGGISLRRGSRTMVRTALPTRLSHVWVIVLLALAGFFALGSWMDGGEPSWWPNTAGAPTPGTWFRDVLPSSGE